MKAQKPMRVLFSILLLASIAAGVSLYFAGNAKKPNAMTPPSETVEINEVSIDLEKATTPRVLGSPDAPVTISEHSSFTCSHCGDFHRNTFKPLKEKYVDTGKVKIVFSDFPLNQPALHASMIARCLPEGRYFDFVQLLFETQENWAYERDYLKYLKQNSGLAGLDGATFDACLNNEELQNAILKGVEEAQAAHEIRSTPSFVLNGEQMIAGAINLEELSKSIDALLAEQETHDNTE